jgi:putative ABC transport system permease protein
MISTYFTMAWRHIIKDKIFSIINICGLSVSMAVCFLIFQYAAFETGYDSYNINAGNIYRVTTERYENNLIISASALSSDLISQAFKDKILEIKQSGRLMSTRYWFDCTLKYTTQTKTYIFNERNLYFADPSILSMFSFDMKEGNAMNALQKPYSAVLSSLSAKKYFGAENPMGKMLHLKGSFDEHDYIVTGVMADLPADAHLDADILLSMSSLENNPYFKTFDTYTYIELIPHANEENIKHKVKNFIHKFLPTLEGNKTMLTLDLQPITDIHLYSSLADEIKPGGNAKSIYFLLLIAFVIVFIAWINYINLTTSRSISRAKEVGIRKVSGANRSQLIKQFLTESLILNVLSIIIASLLVYFLSPSFFLLTGISLHENIFKIKITDTSVAVVIIFFLGIFLSGFYPAYSISSHNPASVLKGKFGVESGSFSLRKVLVIFQFTCAITLGIAVLLFNQQFRFMQSSDLGIEINKTIVVKAPTITDSSYLSHLSNFKYQLQANSIISSATTSSAIPGENIEWTGAVKKDLNSDANLNFTINVVDADFIASYKLKLLAGRNFEVSDFPGKKFGTKTEPVVLNREALKQLRLENSDEAIGSFIYWGNNKCIVIGVIDNFHQRSLKSALAPMLFTVNYGPNLSLKFGEAVNSENIEQSIQIINNAWNSFFPNDPFDYLFLDDFYNKQYANDKRIMTLFNFFCGLAVLVSCLGLSGLASFTAIRRTKEMGIRKVLGAPSLVLISLLIREFLILVMMASCLAIPIAYLGLQQWLQNFAFHILPNVWLYIIPVLFILIVALGVVSFQTLKTVYRNPIETLRRE